MCFYAYFISLLISFALLCNAGPKICCISTTVLDAEISNLDLKDPNNYILPEVTLNIFKHSFAPTEECLAFKNEKPF